MPTWDGPDFVMLQKLGEKDGQEMWLYSTQFGNYGIKHHGYSTMGSREDALAYGNALLNPDSKEAKKYWATRS
jgi:hypothetical protein